MRNQLLADREGHYWVKNPDDLDTCYWDGEHWHFMGSSYALIPDDESLDNFEVVAFIPKPA